MSRFLPLGEGNTTDSPLRAQKHREAHTVRRASLVAQW